MIRWSPGRSRAQQGILRRHPAREAETVRRTFERAKRRLERGPRRVARPRVLEARVLADRLLGEGRARWIGVTTAPVCGSGLLARVDGERLEAERARRSSSVTQSP